MTFIRLVINLKNNVYVRVLQCLLTRPLRTGSLDELSNIIKDFK